jgi:hypothetical protein
MKIKKKGNYKIVICPQCKEPITDKQKSTGLMGIPDMVGQLFHLDCMHKFLTEGVDADKAKALCESIISVTPYIPRSVTIAPKMQHIIIPRHLSGDWQNRIVEDRVVADGSIHVCTCTPEDGIDRPYIVLHGGLKLTMLDWYGQKYCHVCGAILNWKGGEA